MQKFFVKRLAQKWLTSRFCLPLFFALVVTACSPATAPTLAPATLVPIAETAILPTRPPSSQPGPAPSVSPLPSPGASSAATSIPGAETAGPVTTQFPTLTPVAPGVIWFESTVTLNTYPYTEFLRDELDAATNIPYKTLDRQQYDAAQPKPAPRTYRSIVLENEYLQLVFLPELGGRLYQVKNKQTGQNLFYNNAVVKPSPWGMSYQGGWLAAGGMEWAFPTQEHGYEWNVPWAAEVTSDRDGISVTMTDSTADDRPRVRVRVTLPSGGAYFTVQPTIENPTSRPQRIQFWINAALNPGATGVVSPQTEFVLPGDEVWVHSTGNAWIDPQFVPAADATAPAMPITFSDVSGRDLRRYENWDNYLGVFATAPETDGLTQNFVGAYNHTTDLGVVRVFPPAAAPGVKLFGFGPEFCCVDAYTDDGSGYFEIWGGLPRTFFAEDDVTLAPGETRSWTESWMSLPRTGGLSAASADAALFRAQQGEQLVLAVYSAIARDAVIVLKQNDTVLERWEKTFRPGQVWDQRLNLNELQLEDQETQLELQDASGNVIVATR